jgi:Ribbon-helix-helix domain
MRYTAFVKRKPVSRVKTKNREKYALWLDNDALARLRDYQEQVGVPVSESIRRAVDAYLKMFPKKSSK